MLCTRAAGTSYSQDLKGGDNNRIREKRLACTHTLTHPRTHTYARTRTRDSARIRRRNAQYYYYAVLGAARLPTRRKRLIKIYGSVFYFSYRSPVRSRTHLLLVGSTSLRISQPAENGAITQHIVVVTLKTAAIYYYIYVYEYTLHAYYYNNSVVVGRWRRIGDV